MSIEFTTADGRRIIECPACGSFTMTEPDGTWACRGCAKSVIAHVEQVVLRRGFRPKRVRRAAMVVAE